MVAYIAECQTCPHLCVCACISDTWELSRSVTVCFCRSCQCNTHIYIIYIKWCVATLTRWHPLGSHIACWTGSTSFDMLMRTFYVLCLCLRENVCVCVSVHVFYSFAQEQEGDASDVLYFHSGVLLWGKRIPWKLNISLWLAADKDWIICVLLKSPFNFFFLTGMKDFVCGALGAVYPAVW